MSKTEALVYDCFAGVVCSIIPCQTWIALSRAARRFVRMEKENKYDKFIKNYYKNHSKQKGK